MNEIIPAHIHAESALGKPRESAEDTVYTTQRRSNIPLLVVSQDKNRCHRRKRRSFTAGSNYKHLPAWENAAYEAQLVNSSNITGAFQAQLVNCSKFSLVVVVNESGGTPIL